jgi:hypothetical protein
MFREDLKDVLSVAAGRDPQMPGVDRFGYATLSCPNGLDAYLGSRAVHICFRLSEYAGTMHGNVGFVTLAILEVLAYY